MIPTADIWASTARIRWSTSSTRLNARFPILRQNFSVFERARLQSLATEKDAEKPSGAARRAKTLPIEAMGDGSDFAPFIDYLAIPSLDMSFGGEGGGSSYHSIYDDFYYYTHFVRYRRFSMGARCHRPPAAR